MWNDNEFNSTFASPGGGAKDPKKTQIRYIIPVTAETINRCNQVEGENSVFEFNNMRFHHICLIGIIRAVHKRSNDITYVIDDMTAQEVTVKLQSDENDEMENDENVNQQQSQFIENQYVKVYGLLKSLQGQKYVQAFRMLPLRELNEITYHILECMNANIYHASKGGSNDMYSTAPSSSNPLKNANLNGAYNNDNGHNGGGNSFGGGGLSGIYAQISNVIKQDKSSEGVHLRNICEYFKTVSESKIREVLEFLSTEGHIYSTIDDEHYKTTDAV